MDKRGSTGIRIEGASDCRVDNCEFSGFGTAVDIEGGERNAVTRSRFRGNKIAVSIRGGSGHALDGNLFENRRPSSRQEALNAIRQHLTLGDEMPDREILASLRAVLSEGDERGRRDATRKSTLGRWLIEHGSDINLAVNTLVTLAAAVAQWLK
jgi:hypothetical protein